MWEREEPSVVDSESKLCRSVRGRGKKNLKSEIKGVKLQGGERGCMARCTRNMRKGSQRKEGNKRERERKKINIKKKKTEMRCLT